MKVQAKLEATEESMRPITALRSTCSYYHKMHHNNHNNRSRKNKFTPCFQSSTAPHHTLASATDTDSCRGK